MYYDWAHTSNLIDNPDLEWWCSTWTMFLHVYDDWSSRHPGAFAEDWAFCG
jgi:hypothetical protein